MQGLLDQYAMTHIGNIAARSPGNCRRVSVGRATIRGFFSTFRWTYRPEVCKSQKGKRRELVNLTKVDKYRERRKRSLTAIEVAAAKATDEPKLGTANRNAKMAIRQTVSRGDQVLLPSSSLAM